MKKLMLLILALVLSLGSTFAQKTPTTVGDSVTVYFSSGNNADAGCLTQVQVIPPMICSGNVATLTSALAGGSPLLLADWYDENWNLIASNVSTIQVSPAFTSDYHAKVKCLDGSISEVDPTVFVSGIAPVLSFSATPAGCGPTGSIQLSVTDNNPAPYFYVWSSGLPSQEDQNNIPAGTYTVTVSDAEGCTHTGSATVGNNGGNFTATISANGSTSFCQGGSVILTASPAQTYMWTNGATTQSVMVTSGGNYSVTETSNGCTATSNVISVTVNPAPNASISGPTSVCLGSSATLTAFGGGSYMWSGMCWGGETITVTPNATTTYTVTVTNANGCPATASHTLVVNPLPSPAIMVSYPGNGPNASLTASGGTSYLWSNFAPVATINVLANAGTTYTVTVTNANGCTASAVTSVNILPCNPCTPPIAAFGFVVSGMSATFQNLSTGATSYAWSLGDGLFSNQVNPAHNYSLPGTYTVILTATNSCGTSTSTATVTIQAPPCNLTVATSAMDASVNGGADGSVWVTPSGGVGSLTYHWSNGATTADINNLFAGTYCVTVTDANGCSANACATVNQPSAPSCNPNGITNNFNVANGATFCPSTTQFFLISPNWGQTGYVFQWSSGGVTFEPWRILADTDSGPHHYEVLVTAPNGAQSLHCFDYNVLCLSGTADERGPEPSIFPNPIGDGECLNVTGLPAGMYNVMITDQSGRVVTKKVVKQ